MSSDSEDIEDNEFNDENGSEDILKILITTDNHLGFMEKDPERGEDSFIAFEEALQIAEREQVDFILLGGDLFHENKPSRDCLAKCQSLFRKYCFGIKPIEFNIVSDEHVNFGHTNFPYANFNDPNLNVGIPVFSIHGNHDDPTGARNLCALDILASAGLVNYFGKCNTNMQNEIQINPILIEKGETKLAIFGLGAIKDERLHHLFEKGVVKVNRPTENAEDWFSIFVIHQNRVVHGKKNYIPETFLERFLDLVIWGHEHECRLKPEYNELQEFYVTQPGSTVITSLSESETIPKRVGILKISKKKFKLEEVQLSSIRPFLIDSISLKSYSISTTDKNLEAKIEQICVKKVEEMIKEASKTQTESTKKMKPLIRLKVDYTDFDMINEARFAQKFIDKVANPKNILNFYRKQNTDKVDVTLDPDATKYLGAKYLEHIKVEDLVMKYFKEADEKNQLSCLTEQGLSDAIKEYIEKDEKDAILELVNFQIEKTQKHLRSLDTLNEHQIDDEIKKFRRMRIATEKEELGEIKDVFSKISQKSIKTKINDSVSDDFMNDDDDENDEKPNLIKSKTKAKKSAFGDDDDDDDENIRVKIEKEDVDEDEILATSKRGGKGSRGGRGSRGGSTRGRGRGSTAAASKTKTTNKTQLELTNYMMPKQEPISQISSTNSKTTKKSKNDSDSDIELLSNSSITIKHEPLTARQNNTTINTTQKANTQSQRVNATTRKIQYEDDSDDNQSQQVTFDYGSTNRNKTKKADNNDDDDDDDDFNIFKRVNSSKRRKI